MVTIEHVDPTAFAASAAQVLQEAWKAPCMHYTPEYLRWQFTFPGAISPLGVAAFEGKELAGFVGATVRRLCFQNSYSELHLVSFLGVLPAWRSQGIAVRLMEGIFRTLVDRNQAFLWFVQTGGGGERCTLQASQEVGFDPRRLGPFPSYGFMRRPGTEPSTVRVVETADHAALLSVLPSCSGGQTLWNDPDARLLEHYLRDPRQRVMVVLEDAGGAKHGAAMIVRSEVATSQGVSYVPLVDNLFLPQPGADALTALCAYAAQRWPECGPSPMVSIPNAGGIDPALLRAAGMRQTAVGFTGLLQAADDHPFLAATDTNLEIA